MYALETIDKRMSIRKFLDKDVADELLYEILGYASRSPSFKNSQPWEVVIVKKERLKRLSELLLGEFESGRSPEPDIKEGVFPEYIMERMREHMKSRAERFGFDPDDKEAIKRAKVNNYKFYGAPVAIFLFTDKSLPLWSIFDVGAFAYGLTLAATAKGLGSVIQATTVDYPDIIRRELNIADSKKLIAGISLGYPDYSDIANSYKSKRIPVTDFARIIE